MVGEYQVPFDKNGMQYFPFTGEEGFRWVDNFTFDTILTLKGTERGQSAARFIWEDQRGQRYYMFMRDMMDTLQRSVVKKGSVYGRWTFTKRGENYGVKLAKE